MTEIDLTPITRLEYDIDAILNDHAVAEPITRIELILADIVAGNTTTVEPVTRIETYLAIISGADYPVPEPVTRIETFLAIIAGEDYEEPEAVTRLEGLLAEWVEKGSGIWKTVSGTLIHITDALASPMQKCEVTLEPIQDLHGQDAPYPAGGGKNKFNPDNIVLGTYTKSTESWYVDSPTNFSTVYEMEFKENTRYTFTGKATQGLANKNLRFQVVYTDESTANLWASNATDPEIINYTSVEGKSIDRIRVTFGSSSGNVNVENFQIEEGTTATPYSPYSNICPITGWTGCEVTRAGLNICVVKNLYIGGVSGLAIGNDGVLACFNGINGQTYRISGLSGDRNILYKFRGKMDDIKSGASMSVAIGSPSLPYVFTADETCIYCFYRNSTWSESIANSMKVTIGDSATDYEALNIATASVTFPDSAGTVYGGTVDFVSGLLTVDRIITSPPTSASPWYSGYGGWYYVDNRIYAKVGEKYKVKCNLFKTKLTPDATSGIYVDANVVYFQYVKSLLNISTLNEWLNYLQENTVEAVSPLKEPITYQLTPQPISTLKGENNVWSNSNGDTTIIYKAQAE